MAVHYRMTWKAVNGRGGTCNHFHPSPYSASDCRRGRTLAMTTQRMIVAVENGVVRKLTSDEMEWWIGVRFADDHEEEADDNED